MSAQATVADLLALPVQGADRQAILTMCTGSNGRIRPEADVILVIHDRVAALLDGDDDTSMARAERRVE